MDSPRSSEIRAARTTPPPRRAVERSPRSSEKCARCRLMRLKCLPVERVWPGQKCQRCERNGRPCGPNLSRKEEVRSVSQIAPAQAIPAPNSSSVSSTDNGNAGAGGPAIQDDRMDVGDSGSSSEGSPFTDSTGEKYFKAFGRKKLGENVEKWLLKLGYLLIFVEYITSTGSTPSVEAVRSSIFLYAVQVALKRTIEELQFTIPKLARLAETAAGKGDNVQADRIFRRLLEAVQCSSGLSVEVRCSTLSKLVSFYQRIEDEPQLQKALQILSPLSPSGSLDPGIEPNKLLAQSFLKTSRLMSTTISRVVPDMGPAVHSPALHQSIECENPEIFRLVLNAIKNNHGYPSVSQSGKGVPNDPLDPNQDLEGRDTLNRTALFLACRLGDEDKSEALICSGARVNERDCHGHSILEVAAGNGLLKTVTSLIRNQAVVNPDITHGVSTPLQAAAEHGYIDVVRYLLSAGANGYTKRSDEKTAGQLAEENGHQAIAHELRQWCRENRTRSQASTDGGTSQELCSAMQMVPSEHLRFLAAADTPELLPIGQEMDAMVNVEGPQGYRMNCMASDNDFSSNGQPFGDFFLSGMTGGCQDLPSFDPHHPPMNTPFDLSDLLPGMDMR